MFQVGRKYSRSDVFDELRLTPHPTGGNWFTGYVNHNGAFIVFTNVGSPGRTGHDYGNRWEGSRLRWYAKAGTRLDQPQIQQMLDPGSPVHIFWRSDNSKPFEYAGIGVVVEFKDATPVEVLWGFTELTNEGEYLAPDEVPAGTYREGAVRHVEVNAFERSGTARRECIEHYGARCQVCDLAFEERYGEIGIGFIHVHHLVPIGALQGECEVNPIRDLRPVCPNCHAMIHKTDPPLEIDELKGLLRE